MGKRKSTATQSHDTPKRNRKSAEQNTNDTSDEVIAQEKKNHCQIIILANCIRNKGK